MAKTKRSLPPGRQWAYVLKERDGTIEKYAFFYINTVFNLTNCAAILIRLRSPAHGPTDNTNRDATRERYRNALPGDADFEEARRRELVRVHCFFLRHLPYHLFAGPS